jgi:class 3 adenylate cyclase
MGLELKDPSFGAERRHLTVMFCDLVGSSALSVQLDPEDFREIIGAYQKTCAAVVDRFGGYLARYVGDGVLVYFGYPESHEDDAERAIRAAFGIIEALPEINESLSHDRSINLAVRIGVASGLVVAGDIAGAGATEQHAVVGQTPNLAARLQSLAEPNSVLISSQTRQLLGERFEFENLGPHQFKGFSEPTTAWRVIQPLEGLTRFEAAHRRGSIPLVDREQETKRLLECWGRAKAGKGQSVLLAGEAGIGKSRLAESFSERLTSEPHIQLRYQCHSFCQSSAFHPIINELERAARHRREDTAEQKLEKLQRLLANANGQAEEALPLFASLLSIPVNGQYPALHISPRQQKERTLAALADHFVGLSRRRPVFALVEDMHWMDPSSRELFDLIWDRIGTARILLLVTTRDQHISLAWSKAAHASAIALDRLDRDYSVASRFRQSCWKRSCKGPMACRCMSRS